MGWDERLFGLLDDLEQQAEAVFDLERVAELADRSRAEYAAVTLASRLMASVGGEVALEVTGVGLVEGPCSGWRPAGASSATGGHDWLVRLDAVTVSRGRLGPVGARGGVVTAGGAGAGRDAAPAGRRSRAERGAHPRRGRRLVSLTRVGADFVEAGADARRGLLLPRSTSPPCRAATTRGQAG